MKKKDGFKGSRMMVLPQSVVKEMENDSVTELLHLTDIGYFPYAKYHYRQRESGAGQYILIFCTRGKGWIKCEGKMHKLTAGQLFIIPRGAGHSYGADSQDPWSIYWLHFNGKMSPYYGDGYNVPKVSVSISWMTGRIALFEEIYQTLTLGYHMDHLRYISSLLHHFLGSFKFEDSISENHSRNTKNFPMIEKCRNYMEQNIEKRLSLNDIVAVSGYSCTQCTAIFNNTTGMSPMAFLHNIRIQKACKLLDLTDMKINQICEKVGIEDPYYFSRLFSKVIGVSPKKYRSRNRE